MRFQEKCRSALAHPREKVDPILHVGKIVNHLLLDHEIHKSFLGCNLFIEYKHGLALDFPLFITKLLVELQAKHLDHLRPAILKFFRLFVEMFSHFEPFKWFYETHRAYHVTIVWFI